MYNIGAQVSIEFYTAGLQGYTMLALVILVLATLQSAVAAAPGGTPPPPEDILAAAPLAAPDITAKRTDVKAAPGLGVPGGAKETDVLGQPRVVDMVSLPPAEVDYVPKVFFWPALDALPRFAPNDPRRMESGTEPANSLLAALAKRLLDLRQQEDALLLVVSQMTFSRYLSLPNNVVVRFVWQPGTKGEVLPITPCRREQVWHPSRQERQDRRKANRR